MSVSIYAEYYRNWIIKRLSLTGCIFYSLIAITVKRWRGYTCKKKNNKGNDADTKHEIQNVVLHTFLRRKVIDSRNQYIQNNIAKVTHTIIRLGCNVTVDGFIFVGTTFSRLSRNYTLVRFTIRGHIIFLHTRFFVGTRFHGLDPPQTPRQLVPH